ncbi:hypothetical protein BCO18442_07545 [Burkholderia contaminans]|nr:hypothetical protein BCO18442_07545 [Burkholderia contaminans]
MARQYGVSFLSNYLHRDGSLTLKGEAVIDQAKHPTTTLVTASLLQKIQALGQKGIEDAGGLPALARQYGVRLNSLSNHILKNGNLTKRGEALIYQVKHPPTTRVTASLLQEIQALGPQGIKDAGGLPALARQYGVRFNSLSNHILKNGSLTGRGEALIYEAEHPPTTPFTASLLRKIRALGPKGIKDAGGLRALARQYGVRFSSLSKSIRRDGSLTEYGKTIFRQQQPWT